MSGSTASESLLIGSSDVGQALARQRHGGL
jgi:hypothetical protein